VHVLKNISLEVTLRKNKKGERKRKREVGKKGEGRDDEKKVRGNSIHLVLYYKESNLPKKEKRASENEKGGE